MQKIKDFLLGTMGTVGYILFFFISWFLIILPLLMFNMPWLLYIVISSLVVFFLSKIPLFIELMYIAGLFGAISGKQDLFAIIFYIAFAIIVIPTVVRLITALIPRN